MQENKKSIAFIKKNNIPSIRSKKDLRRFLRLHFFDYLNHMGMPNTINVYRQYRSLCQEVYGINLAYSRPMKRIKPVETPMELFS